MVSIAGSLVSKHRNHGFLFPGMLVSEGPDTGVTSPGILKSGIKRFKGGPVYLDLVVHQREYDVVRGFLNYIYVEMKKPQNPDGFNTDRSRVCDMTNPFGGFGYKIGAFLIIVADDTRNYYCLEIHDLYREGLAWELLEDNPR